MRNVTPSDSFFCPANSTKPKEHQIFVTEKSDVEDVFA